MFLKNVSTLNVNKNPNCQPSDVKKLKYQPVGPTCPKQSCSNKTSVKQERTTKVMNKDGTHEKHDIKY